MALTNTPKILQNLSLEELGYSLQSMRGFKNVRQRASTLDLLLRVAQAPFPKRQKTESDADFKQRVTDWWFLIMNNNELHEADHFSDSRHSRLRESLSNHPLLKNCYGLRGSGNVDVLSNSYVSPTKTSISVRDRRMKVGILGIPFFVACHAISRDQNARASLNLKVADMKFPKLLDELLKATRISQAGSWQVAPEYVHLDDEVLSALDLKGTLMDTKFIITDSGINAFINFIGYLKQFEDIIEMVKIKVPDFQSGEQLTLCAWGMTPKEKSKVFEVEVEYTSTIKTGETTIKKYKDTIPTGEDIMLHGINSYSSSGVDQVHASDCILFGMTLVDSQDQIIDLALQGGWTFNTRNLLDRGVHYICKRTFHIIHNHPFKKDPPSGDQAKDKFEGRQGSNASGTPHMPSSGPVPSAPTTPKPENTGQGQVKNTNNEGKRKSRGQKPRKFNKFMNKLDLTQLVYRILGDIIYNNSGFSIRPNGLRITG